MVAEILSSAFSGLGVAFFGGTLAIARRMESKVGEIGERVARIEGKLDKR